MTDGSVSLRDKLLAIESLSQDSFAGDQEARALALSSARALCKRLEKPWDSVARMFWMEPATNMAIKIALDMKLLETLRDAEEPQKSADLARATGADETLVRRILRQLESSAIVEEVNRDTYTPNALSHTLVTSEAAGAMSFLTDVCLPLYARVPESIKHGNFRSPSNPKACPWQHGMSTDLSFFEWLAAHPQHMSKFNGLMKGYAMSRPRWLDFYPTEPLFEKNVEGSPLLVDVGGGAGHDIEWFLKKHPQAAGRLVLQDLPNVIDAAQVSAEITKMAHDFFLPQPVRNARVYFLHSILHNWPEEKAKEILRNLRPAMRKDHSILLLHEAATRVSHPTEMSTSVDIVMMSLFGGAERTEDSWKDLFESVGMRLSKVWTSPAGGQALMEVGLA